MNKERIDVLLVAKGLVSSRERAKSSLMAGLVFVNGQKIEKPGTLVATDANIVVKGDAIGYVSRGGLKLAKAVQFFQLSLNEKIVADIGASTGGFTDCALKNGAVKVFAIDVGYGQLAWSLRTDSRVVNMERTNIRSVTTDMLGTFVDFITIDVSFISLEKVLPVACQLLQPSGTLIALIKPQFEAGKEAVGKKGVVRDPLVHYSVVQRIVSFSRRLSMVVKGVTYSPVKGPEGNIEYLLYLGRGGEDSGLSDDDIQKVVKEAHSKLL